MSKIKEKLNKQIETEIQKLIERLDLLNEKSKRISIIRLVVFLTGLFFFLGCFIYNYKTTSYVGTALIGIIFVFLVIIHNKVEKSIKKFKTFIQIKNELLSRSKLDWMKIPYIDEFYAADSNYLEQDLNITEKNGLLHLINTGVTYESVKILREWLSGRVIDLNKIINRQKIIRELKELNHFRNKLYLATKLCIKTNLLKIEISDWIKKTEKRKVY